MSSDIPFIIAFSVFPGIGPVRFKLLLEYFGTAKSAWEAPSKEWSQVGLPTRLVTEFETFRKTFSLEKYLKELETKHIRVIPSSDPSYPSRLNAISDAPFLLYIRGNQSLSLLNEPKMIGVVGTRMITQYGKEVTRRLTAELVASGFEIVSGLAYGVDAIAHNTAIEQGGKTIAVLGCGVDVIAPSSNTWLYKKIVDGGGLVISEMPLGHLPNKGLFPARNRIISGLSLGVLVTEGAEDSGALITARNAGEQGREVFAVPGPITSLYSRGPAKLLKNGAVLVEKVTDILDEFHLNPGSTRKESIDILNLSNQEKMVVTILSHERKDSDDLIRETHIVSGSMLSLLTSMELKGIIKSFDDGTYGVIDSV